MITKVERKVSFENIVVPIITFIIIFGGLEIIVRGFNISRQILPAPTSILEALVRYFVSDLGKHFVLTLFEILSGFVIGVPLGIAFAGLLSQNKILLRAFSPYVIFLVTTPMLTLVPLFMMWLGFGSKARILVVILQTIPIVTLNSINGFNSIEKFKLDLARSLGATKNQIFLKIIFPNALPQVFTGIKLGAIFSTVAALGAQFAGAKNGLGNRIIYYSRLIQTETAFASIVLVAIIGISMYTIISKIERNVVIWRNY